MDPHRLAEERSIAYHRAVAERLRADPSLVAVARERVQRVIAEGGRAAPYASRWRELLDGPLDALLVLLVDGGERARALRQATPFAGFIDPRERWRIWRELREREGP